MARSGSCKRAATRIARRLGATTATDTPAVANRRRRSAPYPRNALVMPSAELGSPVTGRPASGLTTTISPRPRRRIGSPIAATSRMTRPMSRSTYCLSGASVPAILGRLLERLRRAADQAQPHPGRGTGARQRHADRVRDAGYHHGARACARRIRGAERRQRIGPPLEPLDDAVDRTILRGALVIP